MTVAAPVSHVAIDEGAAGCRRGQLVAATAATLDRPMPKFKLEDIFTPAADQPKAIREIAAAVSRGDRFTTLLGATGTGKTMTMAGVIQELQRPTLVLAHNKTLSLIHI